jgi:hypothetical protein
VSAHRASCRPCRGVPLAVCLLLLVQGGGAVWHPNGPVWNPSDPTKVVGHIDYAPPHIGPWHRLPFRACASSAMWACWCVLVRATRAARAAHAVGSRRAARAGLLCVTARRVFLRALSICHHVLALLYCTVPRA